MNTTTTTTTFPEKMEGGDGDPVVPIEIGARGTVGNLVMKEIEYFRRLQSSNGDGDGKPSIKPINDDKKHRGSGSNFWSSFGFLTVTWRRGKSKGRFLPRMCTMVDVADSRHHRPPSFGYRNLKDDINQFQI
ncbi:hypothetical protein SSX86_027473 [Deinandra increscens subsp. villosa]|uniref:Uncharacterized protein n=1 Tax=Deinandra increscens subsp. villosa TaxID=3103831 RepID=A0AAP0GN46_9ASTR